MKLRNDIVGVILAGGKSSRMGRDKALLELKGMSFIKNIADELQKVFTKVIIVSDRTEAYKFLGLRIYEDIFKNCGPLAGIHSAFIHSRSKVIFVVSTDMPLINSKIIKYILDLSFSNEAIVYSIHNTIQPLFGIYNRTCFSVLEEDHLRRKQYSVVQFLNDIDSIIIPVPASPLCDIARMLVNVNTPEDYQQIISQLCLRQS